MYDDWKLATPPEYDEAYFDPFGGPDEPEGEEPQGEDE